MTPRGLFPAERRIPSMVIIGLGNPGKQYDGTRHNFGFAALDAFWKKYHDEYGLADWKEDRGALVAKSRKLILVKPQTFMNKSGEAVRRFFPPHRGGVRGSAIVVHDDLDLPLGAIRISVNKSSAGHKGVQSVIDHLGTQNFIRVRLGVAPARRTKSGDEFVLERLTKSEYKKVSGVLSHAAEALETIVQDGVDKAMSFINAQ